MTSICLHDPPGNVFTCGYFGCVQDTISHMAQAYDFQYELVQYKWPRWLHQQTEKQRIIWGYKILFLDVLFPLAVDKIIFVDADQVSLKPELRDLSRCVSLVTSLQTISDINY